MRPFALDPLFRTLTVLPGIGDKNATLIAKLIGGPKVLDLFWHKPIDFIDRRFSPKIKETPDGKVATLEITVGKHFPNQRKGSPYKVWCSDETGTINLIFFHARGEWLQKQLPEGEKRIISGRVEYYQGVPQMTHPDYIVRPEERGDIEITEPVYPLTAGVTNKLLHKAIKGALSFMPALPEWLDESHKAREGWSDWDDAVKSMHFESGVTAQTEIEKHIRRLAYDEFLANQLTLALVREKQRVLGGRAFPIAHDLRDKILRALPFTLTDAQKRALAEIDTDMSAPVKMLRLLQGDVGSGKTIVAALTMMNAVAGGMQAAFMAPTEILARQHAETLKPWLEAAGLSFVILTGRDKGAAREAILAQIADGTAQIVIGTHALFQDSITFADLGLAIIDEQHKFGVEQRLQLSRKGKGVDILVMTATPIPRTLALTGYGDMDISVLDEKPAGRKPVDTRLISTDKIEGLIDGIKRYIQTGARIYWVCPLVEESEILDLSAAEQRYDILKSIFGEARTGLVHGRMKADDKDTVMERFANGALDVLVSTTVIEVGVNVPEATVMVIEHAERFGLAQLHQLRGRVGRGHAQSYCFLLYSAPLGETAKERLSIMRKTEDGFIIAEKDMDLRGTGDILGTRQSGLPDFKIGSLIAHKDLLITAANDAKMIVSKDIDFKTPRGQALRTLLYLFEQDQAIKYLQSG